MEQAVWACLEGHSAREQIGNIVLVHLSVLVDQRVHQTHTKPLDRASDRLEMAQLRATGTQVRAKRTTLAAESPWQ